MSGSGRARAGRKFRVEKEMTLTDRLSGFGPDLATKSDSGERVPQGQKQRYSNLVTVPLRLRTVARLLGHFSRGGPIYDPAILDVRYQVAGSTAGARMTRGIKRRVCDW